MDDDRLTHSTFARLIAEGALEIGDGYRAKNDELGGDGLIFLRAGHVTDTRINFEGVEHFHAALEPRVRSKLAKAGDAVVTTKGNSTGRTAFVLASMPPFVYSPHLSYWRSIDLNRIDPGFLRYWSKSVEFTTQLTGMKASTDMAPYLSLIDQKRLEITLPSISVQRAIGHVLSTLDDRIELNRRMNETLEAIAQALFKSWFIDFDPVRAKAAGRDPGLPKHLADLFPDSIEVSEVGEGPKGWEAQPFANIFSLDKGLSYKGAHLCKSGIRMVNLGCFLGRGQFEPRAIKNYSGEFRSKHTIRPGDLVLANTDITQKREILGSPAIVPPTDTSAELIFTHHVYAARFHKDAEKWKLFVYFSMLRDEFRQRAAGFATGTTVLALPRDALLECRFLSPPEALLQTFNRLASTVVERQWASVNESHVLTALRDALLPKLISGELRVQDAEHSVGNAI